MMRSGLSIGRTASVPTPVRQYPSWGSELRSRLLDLTPFRRPPDRRERIILLGGVAHEVVREPRIDLADLRQRSVACLLNSLSRRGRSCFSGAGTERLLRQS